MTRRPDADDAASSDDALRGEFARWAAEPDHGPSLDLEALRADFQSKLAAERGLSGWLCSRSTPVRALFAWAALALVVVVTMVGWLRPDFELYPPARMLVLLAVLAGLLVIDLTLVLWPVQLPAAPRWLTVAGVLLVPLLVFALYALPAAHTAHPRSLQPEGLGPLLWNAGKCLAIGSLVAAPIYVLLRGLDRGGGSRLLLMAACAGLAANLSLQLHCPITAPEHLLLGHLSVLGLCFAVGWLFDRSRA